MLRQHFASLIIFNFILSAIFISCDVTVQKPNDKDTTSTVYGPYRIIKLPINKGVKILNPIQITMGQVD